MSYNITKKFLIQKYNEEQLSSNQIAKLLKISKFCILFNLKKFNIPRRTQSEALKGKQSGRNNPNFRHGETLKKHYCINCGNIISYPTFKYGQGRCHSCSSKGENNSNFNNWSSFEPYPLGWTNTFKEQIRFRDGYKCQICGCHEVECIKKLHVHHIDYNKENLDQNNLISLCHSCHTKTNFNRKEWIEYFQVKKQNESKL